MSGDETDPENCGPAKTFLIIRPHWQSAELGDFLHKLDHANWRNPHGQRAIRGNPPQYHVPSALLEEGSAPANLPRNCYDPDWLRSLRPWMHAKLEVDEDLYSFYINPEELEELQRTS